MLMYQIVINAQGHKELHTSVRGKALLTISQLNKGTAFTAEERSAFGLVGKLPSQIESLDEQLQRAYLQYRSYNQQINKNIYLNYLLNNNEILFYKLISAHIEEMLPTVYTPIVGNAVQEFSRRFTQPRGLYITYNDQDRMDEILANRTNPDIRLIVVSDGEGVLGIGDQGVGAMAIPVAKLMVYTAVGHVNPNYTLPILLDAGTNNQQLLDDPLYLGWRHPRVSGADYDRFIDQFIAAVKRQCPNVFLHWEDFGRHNAYRNLAIYREKICSFNDDIQGTGVVTLAALMAACEQTDITLAEQRIVIFGAGSAGIGVADNIVFALEQTGLTANEARARVYLVDRSGLLTDYVKSEATPAQEPYLRSQADVADWVVADRRSISLLDVVQHLKPTVLIGASARPGAFTAEIIRAMAAAVKRPIIFPLSNPTELCEATPADLLTWTDGRALIASGSPFAPVNYQGTEFPISQCNNYLAFPGIGLGVIAVKAQRVSQAMLLAASRALSVYSQTSPPRLLPSIEQVAKQAARDVALAVAKTAVAEGFAAAMTDAEIVAAVEQMMWEPAYLPYYNRFT